MAALGAIAERAVLSAARPTAAALNAGRVSCCGVFTGFLATLEALVADGLAPGATRVLSAASLLWAAARAASLELPFLAGAAFAEPFLTGVAFVLATVFGAGAGVTPRPLLTVLAGAAAGRAGFGFGGHEKRSYERQHEMRGGQRAYLPAPECQRRGGTLSGARQESENLFGCGKRQVSQMLDQFLYAIQLKTFSPDSLEDALYSP